MLKELYRPLFFTNEGTVFPKFDLIWLDLIYITNNKIAKFMFSSKAWRFCEGIGFRFLPASALCSEVQVRDVISALQEPCTPCAGLGDTLQGYCHLQCTMYKYLCLPSMFLFHIECNPWPCSLQHCTYLHILSFQKYLTEIYTKLQQWHQFKMKDKLIEIYW